MSARITFGVQRIRHTSPGMSHNRGTSHYTWSVVKYRGTRAVERDRDWPTEKSAANAKRLYEAGHSDLFGASMVVLAVEFKIAFGENWSV